MPAEISAGARVHAWLSRYCSARYVKRIQRARIYPRKKKKKLRRRQLPCGIAVRFAAARNDLTPNKIAILACPPKFDTPTVH